MWHIFRMKRLKFKYQASEFIPKTILTNLSATEPQHWNENTLRHKLKNKNHKKRKVYTQRLYIQPTWTCYIKVSKKKSHGSTLHDCSPALRCTDDVLFVAACTRFRQAGDGGCVTKQHCPGTNLSRKHKRGAECLMRGGEEADWIKLEHKHSPPAQASCPRDRSVHRGSRWWWW